MVSHAGPVRDEEVTSGERADVPVAPADPAAPAFSEAFVAFYRQRYPDAVRLATLLCGGAAAGEDVAQDAFLAVAPRFGDLEAPAPYLTTTVVNLARRRHRDRERRLRRLHVLAGGQGPASAPDEGELADVVAALPFRQRVVVVGRYWAGWSEVEIAAHLGCRPGTVKSLASRALATLRQKIEEAPAP